LVLLYVKFVLLIDGRGCSAYDSEQVHTFTLEDALENVRLVLNELTGVMRYSQKTEFQGRYGPMIGAVGGSELVWLEEGTPCTVMEVDGITGDRMKLVVVGNVFYKPLVPQDCTFKGN